MVLDYFQGSRLMETRSVWIVTVVHEVAPTKSWLVNESSPFAKHSVDCLLPPIIEGNDICPDGSLLHAFGKEVSFVVNSPLEFGGCIDEFD